LLIHLLVRLDCRDGNIESVHAGKIVRVVAVELLDLSEQQRQELARAVLFWLSVGHNHFSHCRAAVAAWEQLTVTQIANHKISEAIQSFSSKTRGKNILLDKIRGRTRCAASTLFTLFDSQLK